MLRCSISEATRRPSAGATPYPRPPGGGAMPLSPMNQRHCGRTNPEAFLAFEKDAKDWSRRP